MPVIDDTVRTCRIAGCTNQHKNWLFCCRHHWFRLLKHYRDDIWRAYREHGVISVEYLQAAENAEAYLEHRDARDITASIAPSTTSASEDPTEKGTRR